MPVLALPAGAGGELSHAGQPYFARAESPGVLLFSGIVNRKRMLGLTYDLRTGSMPDAGGVYGQATWVAEHQRRGAHYLRAKEEIFSRKRLGRVTMVRSYWSDLPWKARRIAAQPKPSGLDWERFLGSAPRRSYEWIRYDAWRYFRDYQNGLLADVFVHWADVAQWMMGETHPISAPVSGGLLRDETNIGTRRARKPDTASIPRYRLPLRSPWFYLFI
jgi:hypothetical protein